MQFTKHTKNYNDVLVHYSLLTMSLRHRSPYCTHISYYSFCLSQKWVRPIFSESDHLMMNPPVQEMPVKQLEVIMLTCGSIKERSSEDNQGNGRHGIASLLSLAPHSSSLLYFSGGSGHSTGHSAGQIGRASCRERV